MDLVQEIAAAEAQGMLTALWARKRPNAPAAYDKNGMRTLAQVNASANRLVRLLRARGVQPGEHVAMLIGNRAEAMEIMAATLRGGFRLIPLNWRLTEGEIAYIIDNSDAVALLADTQYEAGRAAARAATNLKARIGVGGEADGFEHYDTALAAFDGTDIPDPLPGLTMFYTSGTTGRPKGVYRNRLTPVTAGIDQYDRDVDVQMCVCPIYHGAGLTLDTRTPMSAGVPVVFVERWDSEEVLRTIEQLRITHMHLVPIMFQRLLALPAEVRARYDHSSLKHVLHGAAPCPPDVKRAMIEWWGPVINEYYSATEGGGGFRTTSEEWLKRPGTVGKRPPLADMKVLDDDGNPCPVGAPGVLYYRRATEPFVYYKDPEKTDSVYSGEYFTLGDVGYFDEEDYLFLTGRTADCIISGGVNIYPQEIDNEIIKHRAVDDSATVGVPNKEWGEEVKAVVTLKAGFAASDDLAQDILHSVRGALAGYKIPRSVDFVADLPRNAAGKIERRRVRAPYWEGRKIQI